MSADLRALAGGGLAVALFWLAWVAALRTPLGEVVATVGGIVVWMGLMALIAFPSSSGLHGGDDERHAPDGSDDE